jgi:hypothetical protein
MQQKKLCSQKFNSCNTEEELNHFASWIEKQKASIQRKINGNEIKDKAGLQKFISLYQEYESKINTKRNTLNQNKEE